MSIQVCEGLGSLNVAAGGDEENMKGSALTLGYSSIFRYRILDLKSAILRKQKKKKKKEKKRNHLARGDLVKEYKVSCNR